MIVVETLNIAICLGFSIRVLVPGRGGVREGGK